MSETDSPEGSGNDTALSVEQGAAAIEGLLSRVPDVVEKPAQDSATNEESQDKGQDTPIAAEAQDEADDDLILEPDEEASAETADAPKEPEFKAGQFAAHDAKVKLEDGSTISVSDLIAGNMFQRKFTEKTTALAQEKKAFEDERGQFADSINQIKQQRDIILTLANHLLPQEPVIPTDPNDPVAYIDYRREKDIYDAQMGQLHYLLQQQRAEQGQLTQKQQKEQEEQTKEYQSQFQNALATEKEKLFETLPRLKDDTEREKFFQEAVVVGKHYGLTPEEIKGIADHRYVRVLADAMAFRKAVAKRDSGKAPAQVPAQNQQARIPQRQRMATQTVQDRDASSAAERLRKTNSLEDGARALERFV